MAEILITGGRGFIGTNLARELQTRGHRVRTLDCLPSPHPRHIHADVRLYRQLADAFGQHDFEYVFHLAAEYGRWHGERHYESLWQTNVVGTKNILKLQEHYGFRMIFFSSAEVYGDYDGLMSEDVMERIPIRQMNDYAISKWAGELQCLNHAEQSGVEVVRVRPVGCYGPHEYYNPQRGVIARFVYQVLNDDPIDVHRGHKRIFDYVDDTCRTFANIVDHFQPGSVYNIGGMEEWALSIEELASMVVRAAGKDPSLIRYHDQELHTTRIKIVDFSKARQELNHAPRIDIQEGLDRYVRWARTAYCSHPQTLP